VGSVTIDSRRRASTRTTSSVAYALTKRAMDIAASAAGLTLLAPALLGIAIAVRFDSPGPAIFRQHRLGRSGVPFVMYKFRSMRATPTMGSGGPQVTAAGDARVTRVGRFLRRYKLDELPQLVNVLKGDMSLVGPRPEVERYARFYPEEYARVLTVRPGITDFATLAFRHEEELLASRPDPEAAYVREVLPKKISLYLRYIEERSARTDLLLIARTIWSVVS
jgi:lipopolysaccharide/colanic/teichoic acid biosynthesis glycosyltransferase